MVHVRRAYPEAYLPNERPARVTPLGQLTGEVYITLYAQQT